MASLSSLARVLAAALLLLVPSTSALPSRLHSAPVEDAARCLTLRFSQPSASSSLSSRDSGDWAPAINANFPDPCIVQDGDTYYAFATGGNGHHIQIASASDPFGNWTLHDADMLPEKGWTSGVNYWAPDVIPLDNGNWVMFFSGDMPNLGRHCIGVARSPNITGPYTMDSSPIVCPTAQGGAVDASWFEWDGEPYLTWKVDGNTIRGPDPKTPLMAQRISADARSMIGEASVLLHRIADEGKNIEAPDLVALPDGAGTALFYSSHFFNTAAYDVRYALADTVLGPYTRAASPLLESPEYGLDGPGGWQSLKNGNIGVFHSWCREHTRCMYVVEYTFT